MAYTTINKSSDYFNTILNTGDGTTNKSFTGVGFQPDLVWNKIRSTTYGHWLYDAVRGAGAEKEISSNTTSAEGASDNEIYGYISSFDSDGFSVTGSSNSAYFNQNNETYVNWCWKANGAGVSNTDGSITSTVSANTTSGFSIVKWNGQTGTVGHGLGAKPAFIVVKCLGISNSWVGTHQGLGTNMSDNYIILNSSNASGSTNWGGEPTSSVFSINSNVAENNDNIAYCFAEKQGFSKFGSYTGNGSTDAPFIYTGFKPSFIMLKNITTAQDWQMYTFDMQPFNEFCTTSAGRLKANTTDAQSTKSAFDMLSNGFKMRTSASDINASGNEIIYMAFAEAPLVGSNNVPCTAR